VTGELRFTAWHFTRWGDLTFCGLHSVFFRPAISMNKFAHTRCTPSVLVLLGILTMLSSCDPTYHLYVVNRGSSECSVQAWPEMDTAFFSNNNAPSGVVHVDHVKISAGDSIQVCKGMFGATPEYLCIDSLQIQRPDGSISRFRRSAIAERSIRLRKGFIRRFYSFRVQ
jgi:hypothetical protein